MASFSFRSGGGLYRVPDTGGAPALVLPRTPRARSLPCLPAVSPRRPAFLLLWSIPAGSNFIGAGSLDSKTVEHLAQASTDALYAPPGYLFYLDQSTLMARPFDARGAALHRARRSSGPERRVLHRLAIRCALKHNFAARKP